VRGDDDAVTASPALALAPPALVENWRALFRFDRGWSAEDYRRARAAWPKALELVRIMHERGVLLAAGTDANNPWTPPGESFHRELELLAQAGITANDVIGIATRNGAKALGILDEAGTIEVGKRADVVLLERDPIVDISAVRSVRWVMKAGRRFDPADLLATAVH
jgi:imidazolonepropionase-like amidohydrolase